MKTRILPLLIIFWASIGAFAQTTVSLAGVCVDCPATINAFINCSVSSAGTLQEGAVVGAGVTQTISVSVTKVGKYSLSTTANGITFSATGTFTATGTQNVVLTASGVPAAAGTTNFTLTSGALSCTFSRTVGNPAMVIAGACPTKLRFTQTNESAQSVGSGIDNYEFNTKSYALSTDSVLYALPYTFHTKPATTFYKRNYSPLKIQNLPKIVAISGNNGNIPPLGQAFAPLWAVGVDGNMYLIALFPTGSNVGPDLRNSGNTYVTTYVGPASSTSATNIANPGVYKFPLPPTGTKWVDCSNNWGMNDLGEVYTYYGSNRTPLDPDPELTPRKLPNPAGTPATFKYVSFVDVIGYQILRGNDGNYYSWGGQRVTGGSSYGNTSLGWGSSEITSPPTTGAGYADVANGFPVAADIRKMQYPAGIVLQRGSPNMTVDGRCFVLGGIGYNISSKAADGIYMYYPFKDGDYDMTRSDIFNGSANPSIGTIMTTTPREIALPPGATKFITSPIAATAAIAYDYWFPNVETARGGTPVKAFTDNGMYGYFDKKFAHDASTRGFDFLNMVSSPSGTVYVPKYMPTLPGFQNSIPVINHYGLDAVTGAFYTKIRSALIDYGVYGASNNATVVNNRHPQNHATVEHFIHMLNGNCDDNNPHPEPNN